MRKFIHIFSILILCSSYSISQINRNSDKGYRFYKENRFEDAIKFWESKLKSSNSKYTTQAKYLMGQSHLELVSLYLMASEIVSKTESNYYDFLLNEKGNNKNVIWLFKTISLVESGDYSKANKVFNKISKSKFNSHLSNIYNTYKKVLKSEEKRTTHKTISTKFPSLSEKTNLDKVKSYLNKNGLVNLVYTDKSKKQRDIRFYSPSIYSLAVYKHLLSAESLFLDLSQNGSSQISSRAAGNLAEIYFLLAEEEKLDRLSIKKSNLEKVIAFKKLSDFSRVNSSSSISILKKIEDEKLKSLIGYYLILFGINEQDGNNLIRDAYRTDRNSKTQLYYGYSLLHKNSTDSFINAEEILNQLYTRSRTTDFNKNKPIIALLYSYAAFMKSPNNACPESLGIAQLLSTYSEIFSQYHNAMQGNCLYYSTLGEGEVKFD